MQPDAMQSGAETASGDYSEDGAAAALPASFVLCYTTVL